jgi:hypothetical protein
MFALALIAAVLGIEDRQARTSSYRFIRVSDYPRQIPGISPAPVEVTLTPVAKSDGKRYRI